MWIPFECEDCGGKGYDSGSLNEPEECRSCLGSGQELVEMDPLVYHYLERKPMGRVTLPPMMTAGELAERSGRYGD